MINFHSKTMILALALLLMLSMTACQSKTPITADVFQQKMEAAGHTVVDSSEQYAGYPHVLKVLVSNSDILHLEFFEIDTLDNAAGVFSSNKTTVEAYNGVSSSVQVNNYQKYTTKTSEQYYVVVQVEKTLVYAFCNAADSSKLDQVINDLGY
jgi:ABC-type uncharacterized transport system auxiliary subunit